MEALDQAAHTGNSYIQKLSLPDWEIKGMAVDVLRLDLIHPVISGNKWFKLKYHIAAAQQQKATGLISVGGAWSNHLLALACACRQIGLRSAAVIRGEEPGVYNPSLRLMKNYGMQLSFIGRDSFRMLKTDPALCSSEFPDYYFVPEGGGGKPGIAGASEILDLAPKGIYTHIACSVGTGATLCGLINSIQPAQKVIGISSLKLPATTDEDDHELIRFIRDHSNNDRYTINKDYHFGGYAKKSNELISFMNSLFMDHKQPTDIVYTGKLFYGLFDMYKKDHFSRGDRLLIVHTGGLMGNKSMTGGILDF